jgi:hypothetical protein
LPPCVTWEPGRGGHERGHPTYINVMGAARRAPAEVEMAEQGRSSKPAPAGRQSQRPGQPGRYQPRIGQRDAETLDSTPPENPAEEEADRGRMPSGRSPRRGSRRR